MGYWLVIYSINGYIQDEAFNDRDSAFKFAAKHNGYVIYAIRMFSPKTVKKEVEK